MTPIRHRVEKAAYIMLMHSFPGLTVPPAVLDGVRSGAIPAFCLFRHYNYESLAQLRALCVSLHEAAAAGGLPPPLIGIDQEGGQLIAVDHGATELPGNMALGATRSPALAHAAGRVLGRELLALGINLNFAPSVDVNSNPHNPGIGIRSFGDDPALVGELGAALIVGMQAEGVLATAKHFPGHGDTGVDSHFDLPVSDHDLARLRAVELPPFAAAIAAGTAAIMTAHMRVTALDAEQPATLSRAVLVDLLRGELGFTGLIITDAMDMAAVARLGDDVSIPAALRGGADLVLLGHLDDQIGLTERTRPLWNAASLERIAATRAGLRRDLPDLSSVGSAEHRAIAQQIADAAVTLTQGELPVNLPPDGELAVVTVQPRNLTPADSSASVRVTLADAIARRHPVHALTLAREADAAEITAALEACRAAHTVIVGTNDAYRDPAQRDFVQALHERGQRVIIVALRTPYDAAAFPQVAAVLCVYGVRAANCEAAARALFGEITAAGVLPCRLPETV